MLRAHTHTHTAGLVVAAVFSLYDRVRTNSPFPDHSVSIGLASFICGKDVEEGGGGGEKEEEGRKRSAGGGNV